MGIIASRQFKKALQSGSEEAALQLYHSNDELWSMDPSRRYGLVNKTTPLHYAARKEFKQLFKEFMINGGNPNAENYLKQSVVHEICTSTRGADPSVDSIRADMLLFLISFCTDPKATCPEVYKDLKPQLLNLNKQDSSLNTPLHLAATSGLLLCARILTDHRALITYTNIADQTPLDCAAESHHDALVSLLEVKVVFAAAPRSSVALMKVPEALRQESYQGMRENDLQVTRDELIIEASSALGTSLTDTAALLQAYGWSKVLLVEAWLENTEAVCKKAKIQLPVRRQLSLASGIGSRQLSIEERECEICSEPIIDVVPIPCGHSFCRNCWSEYLQVKIGDGKVTQLHCPAMGCEQIVPFELISLVVGPDLSAKYLKFGLDAFVEASEDIRWCPNPGCTRAVRLKPEESELKEAEQQAQQGQDGAKKAANPRIVDCGMGHFFCWACSLEPHDPCSCEMWAEWKCKILQEDKDNAMNTFIASGASSVGWVAENTKPCPSCKCPIEKNDGCNHMTCSRCRHQFCWVCLGSWTFHGSRTGGYFQCNKFRAAKNAKEKLEKAKSAANKMATKELEEYFKHVYSRFQNHNNSLQMEEQYLVSAKVKAAALLAAASEDAHVSDASFFEEAVRELLKSRQVLRACYALGYFLENYSAYKEMVKVIAQLERTTEALAEVVARPYLKTPKDKVILATVEGREARRKCLPEVRKLVPTKQQAPPDPADPNSGEESPLHGENENDGVQAQIGQRRDSFISSSSDGSEDEAQGGRGGAVPPPPPPPPPPVQFNWRQQLMQGTILLTCHDGSCTLLPPLPLPLLFFLITVR